MIKRILDQWTADQEQKRRCLTTALSTPPARAAAPSRPRRRGLGHGWNGINAS
ncbi:MULTISPECIES: hypothetical protein [unclassified Streptomyces]|uniref:hypothetical protein n=1 Tax=unclassified Streptomyces TaxID=2593676 RepID=UPI002258C2DD|nr:hypothetical protein [Streptomyces sp. NBC_00047]MCX5612519.1 hypothetical protein [Streptomyces sp. NBC_00047]